MIKLPKTKSEFLKSSRVLVTLVIVALKATVFQAYGMEKYKDELSSYDIRAGEVVTIEGLDFVLTSESDKFKETMIRELAVVSMEGFKAGMVSMRKMFRALGLEIHSDSKDEKVLVAAKGEIHEIIKVVAKDFSLGQLKIMHGYATNPLIVSFVKDYSPIICGFYDYLKHGFEQYRCPSLNFPESKVLGGLEKMHEKMYDLVVKYEPSVCHYMESQKSNPNWDGLIPADIWSEIVQSQYGGYSEDKQFTPAERTNILYQSTWKMYKDLLDKHSEAVKITNDFMGKYEAIYHTYDQKLDALITARIGPIATRIYRS